jgi:hypothetical protein
MDAGKNKDQRKEVREQLVGDILWRHADGTVDDTLLEGTFVDESISGMSILTMKPVEEGSLLKLYCKNRWTGSRYATVKWCREIGPATYRSGLIITEV